MFSYEMVGRKPAVYKVEDGYRRGTVTQTGDTTRSKRWKLRVPVDPKPEAEGGEPDHVSHHRSRREAFHFFKTGYKFVTKPVYQVLGGRKGNKRIR